MVGRTVLQQVRSLLKGCGGSDSSAGQVSAGRLWWVGQFCNRSGLCWKVLVGQTFLQQVRSLLEGCGGSDSSATGQVSAGKVLVGQTFLQQVRSLLEGCGGSDISCNRSGLCWKVVVGRTVLQQTLHCHWTCAPGAHIQNDFSMEPGEHVMSEPAVARAQFHNDHQVFSRKGVYTDPVCCNKDVGCKCVGVTVVSKLPRGHVDRQGKVR